MIDWREYRNHQIGDGDTLLIRTPWDDAEYPDEFKRWLTLLKAQNVNCFNHPDLILWTTDKDLYLQELQDRGVPIVPTRVWCGDNNLKKFKYLLRKCLHQWSPLGYRGLVIKPTVGCMGKNVKLVEDVDGLSHVPDRSCLVQPFLGTVKALGEISVVIYLDVNHQGSLPSLKTYYCPRLHRPVAMRYFAVQKFPPAGRITVQGGKHYPYEVPTSSRYAKISCEVMQMVYQKGLGLPLWFRIDFLTDVKGEPVVSELESIPGLFFKEMPVAHLDCLYRSLQVLLATRVATAE